MSGKSRAAPVTLAALVGALAGFAISPVPMHFDVEWLAWLLVPVFALVGGAIAFFHPAIAADKE